MQMTAGQYELERIGAENQRSQSGLDLGIIDHYNGTRRSVKTLSGGESFKASLALALGLYMLAGHCALKPLFARPRPCDLRSEMLTLVARPHGWSFPSGHTSSAFAAAFALWLQNRRLGVPALALAGFIGFTRMYLYVHFPTDILGGVALGLALGACGSLLADKISNKWAKRSEVKRTV